MFKGNLCNVYDILQYSSTETRKTKSAFCRIDENLRCFKWTPVWMKKVNLKFEMFQMDSCVDEKG